ncbi:hypothetical protein M407DRAFT_5641 [Tulasnella calospora MUT 4182]|uniref:Uncharacterized protein n=1 Tax=Tulasnella calospora MUT 4182 TaxID=1051891 RepID=A0A0C3L9C3_9AGAM|nr:hypothetical protein M407DRAFT_5641 [Tulasnella calospora MUT 4182]
MRRRFFKGFSKDVDLAESDITEAYVKNEKERRVRFSVNPFRLPQQNLPGGAPNEDEESERPPEWLELAGDLAWTATFSSLTSNTAVTEPNAVWNYAVFFGLTWHLWATQTTYDIKYYTNDWWHRFFFASQLGVYAILASFSGSFNVAWKIHPESLDIFVGNSTALTAQAMVQNQGILIEKSFRGINMMLFLSRMFLLAQYVRVIWYRHKSNRFWSWRFLLTPLATLGAGSIFLACFIMLKDLGGTRTIAITQLSLWAVAIIIQITAAAFTPEDGNLTLKSTSAMAPRLSTLTVIIMGEGLNAICATLRNSINSLGLTPRMVSESVTFLEEVWLWLHFPLHLSLILLLEGIKNLFIYVNVLEALNLLGDAFQDVVTYFNENGKFPDHPRLEKLLLVLQMSWEQEVNDMWAAISSNPTNAVETTTSQMWRWWSTVTHNVILMYNATPDPEGEYWFANLVGSNNTVVANDMNTGGPLFDKFTNPYNELMAYSAHWVIAAAGTLLVCMAILNVMQRRPRNRFAWGYSLSRTVIGCLLIVIGGATSNVGAKSKDWYTWIIPTVAIGYSLAVIADWVLLYLSVKSIEQKEALARANIAYSKVGKLDVDSSPAVDFGVQQLPYRQTPSVQSHNSLNAPSLYSLGENESTAHLYAAPIAGATYSPNTTTQVTDPYATGQYQPVGTMYPPIQQLPPYQANTNGSRRSYTDQTTLSGPNGGRARGEWTWRRGQAYIPRQGIKDWFNALGRVVMPTAPEPMTYSDDSSLTTFWSGSGPTNDASPHWHAGTIITLSHAGKETPAYSTSVQSMVMPLTEEERDGNRKPLEAQITHGCELYVKNEKERFVPFSVNPFREPPHELTGKASAEDEESERPPEWLELAGDLAWTATFSSLTSNTSVTEPSAVWNYAVFFCLTWHLWATQTTYDIRYYTNDWWHRILFASQLGVYALLAAFSGSFNISWQIDTDATDVFKGNVTELTGQAMDANQEYLITKSFRSINALLFISRMLLFAQYVRVMWYRKRTGQFWSWRFLLRPLSLLFAGGIFLGCFAIIKEDPDSKTVAITQLILWGIAVISQAIAGAFTPDDGEGALKNQSAMEPRLASLTVIILGEGLNTICGTLRHSMNSLGLSKTMAGQSLTMLLILYFTWLLYFDGFRIKYSPSKVLEELWLCLHFPLHLSLILLLEGVKNIFIAANVLESVNRLGAALSDAVIQYSETGLFPQHPRLEKLLRVLQMSWQQEVNDLVDAINKDAVLPTGDTFNLDSQLWRWWGTVMHNLFLLYNDQPDPEAEFNFQTFAQSNDTVIAEDYNNPESPLFKSFTNQYFYQLEYSGHWVIAVGGTLILCMAILNTVQRRPRNRSAWGYSSSRAIIGVMLIIFGGVTSKWTTKVGWYIWILPTIGIAYGVAVVVDWFILFFSVRSIRNAESVSRSNTAYSSAEKGDNDHESRVGLAHFSHLPYGHENPRRSESPPAGLYAQGPVDSSASLIIFPNPITCWITLYMFIGWSVMRVDMTMGPSPELDAVHSFKGESTEMGDRVNGAGTRTLIAIGSGPVNLYRHSDNQNLGVTLEDELQPNLTTHEECSRQATQNRPELYEILAKRNPGPRGMVGRVKRTTKDLTIE